MKINAIIPRFGKEAVGGAERHASDVLQVLSDQGDIHIHTTTAIDYLTWKNVYKPGIYKEDIWTIHRYKTDKKRNLGKFNRFTDNLTKKYPDQSTDEEWKWFQAQGPVSRDFIGFLESDKNKADLNIYFSYLYLPTVAGLRFSSKRSIIVPMLHDEFPAYLKTFQEIFSNDLAYSFNAPEEKDLFDKIYGYTPSRYSCIGTYVPIPIFQKSFLSGYQLTDSTHQSSYLICIGRMDAGKGYSELLEYFLEWKKKNPSSTLELRIVGKNPTNLEKKYRNSSVKFLGYLSEEEKQKQIQNSLLLVNPSMMESFSIVTMEAWSYAKPVLVNSRSMVLQGHCKRSNGGLYYSDYVSFEKTLDLILESPNLLDRMGINGREYVIKNFTKDVVAKKWIQFINETLDSSHTFR